MFLMFHVLELAWRENPVMLDLVLHGLPGLHGRNVLSHVEEDPEPGYESAGRDGTTETVLVRTRRLRPAMTTSALPGLSGLSGHSAHSHVGVGREQR